MRSGIASVLLLLTSGCATLGLAEKPDAFQQKLALIREAKCDAVGRIPPGLTVDPGDVRAKTTGCPMQELDPRNLQFESLAAGKICFIKRVEVRSGQTKGGPSVGPEESDPEYLLKDMRDPPFVVEAFKTLKGLPPRPAYVRASGTPLDTITVIRNELVKETVNKENGKVGSIDARHFEFRMCGKAPAVTAETRYITVAHPLSALDSADTQLYVWAITDGESPSLDL